MARKQTHIMIVDDHQIIVDGIKALISGVKDFNVVAEANNGKEALAILEKIAVDVILMDIEMPILNGCDATAIITSRYPTIKVIALTVYDEKIIVKKMLQAGASGYVLKNINREILLDAINTVIRGEKYFSSEIPIVLAASHTEESTSFEKQSYIDSVLSDREIEVLRYIVCGLSNNEIAKKLFLSSKTIDTHRANIMQKLNIHNVVGLVKYAIKSGLIKLDSPS